MGRVSHFVNILMCLICRYLQLNKKSKVNKSKCCNMHNTTCAACDLWCCMFCRKSYFVIVGVGLHWYNMFNVGCQYSVLSTAYMCSTCDLPITIQFFISKKERRTYLYASVTFRSVLLEGVVEK
jgi:hypothetical protein